MHDDELPGPVCDALRWCARTPCTKRIKMREATIREIERLGMHWQLSGRVDAWFAGCDPVVRAVSGEVNGPLMQQLAE